MLTEQQCKELEQINSDKGYAAAGQALMKMLRKPSEQNRKRQSDDDQKIKQAKATEDGQQETEDGILHADPVGKALSDRRPAGLS